MSPPQEAPAPGTKLDYGAAWSILHNPAKVDDADGLATFMQGLGLSEAAELEHCESEDVTELASKLKKLPKRIFLKAMGYTP
jgi:hypothetical protein